MKKYVIGFLLVLTVIVVPVTNFTFVKAFQQTKHVDIRAETDDVQIKIEGGIAKWTVQVYNPYNYSFRAYCIVNYSLFKNKSTEKIDWDTMPLHWYGPFRYVMGFIFISIQVTALDKTAMRKGIIVGPFVIFGKYL